MPVELFQKAFGFTPSKADLKIYYLSLPEVFLSSTELSIYAGLFFMIPIVIYLAWYEFHVVSSINAARGYMFIIMAIVLFYAGSDILLLHRVAVRHQVPCCLWKRMPIISWR